MHAKGAEPILKTPLDVFGLDVTCHFDSETLTMKVSLMVPGEFPDSRLQLKRFIPFPLRSAEDTEGLYVLPLIPSDLLGVRLSDNNADPYIRSISAEDLSTCHRHGDLHMCSTATWEHQSLGSDCLASLYLASLKPSFSTVKKDCPFTPADSQSYAVRTGAQDYRVFLAQPQPLTGRCFSGTSSLGTRQGLLRVNIPWNCSVQTRDFVLKPQQRLQDMSPLMESHELTISEGWKDDSALNLHLAHRLGYVSPSGLTLDDAQDFVKHEEGVLNTHNPWVSALLWGAVTFVATALLLSILHLCGVDLRLCFQITKSYFKVLCCRRPSQPPLVAPVASTPFP